MTNILNIYTDKYTLLQHYDKHIEIYTDKYTLLQHYDKHIEDIYRQVVLSRALINLEHRSHTTRDKLYVSDHFINTIEIFS